MSGVTTPGNESVRSEVGYIPGIEGLRGVAVLWVVLFHYVVVRSGKFADPFVDVVDTTHVLQVVLRNGYLGVDLFFLITGFLLTLPWFKHAAEGRAPPDAREFYIRRARRILPAYYVQLVLLFALFVPVLLGPLWLHATWLVLANLGLHLTFLHYTTPLSSASMSVNGALWTLALEMQYYLLLPLIAPCFVRYPRTAAAMMIAATFGWRLLAARDLQPLLSFYASIGARWHPSDWDLRHLAQTQLPGYLAHFAFGILCGRAWLTSRGTAPHVGRDLMLAGVAIGAVLALYAMLAAGFPATEYAALMIPAAMAVAMWAAVSRRPAWARRFLGNTPLAFVGRISYSMYLYHLPLLLLFGKFAPAAFGYLAFPCYFGILVGVSALSFRYVELPFMQPPVRSGGTGGLRERRSSSRA